MQKTGLIIKEEKIDLNIMKNKILKWLKNLKKVFRIILEEELSSSCKEIDHEIKLKIKEIKLLLLDLIRLEKQ